MSKALEPKCDYFLDQTADVYAVLYLAYTFSLILSFLNVFSPKTVLNDESESRGLVFVKCE
jgi:hypothetical protein